MTRYRVLLIPPHGQAWDVTDRVADLGTITESLEDSLLTLAHSDLSLELDDNDGRVWASLGVAAPSDRWDLRVHRTTGRRRPKWERVFGGVLDLPWSVSRDLADRSVEIEAFSYSKLLERASAEGVRRTFVALTGSITSGTTALTMSSTTGLQRGDAVKLDNGNGTTEDFTIAQVTGGTTAVVSANASNTFASATATVETPYYRDAAPATVAALLLAEAGFDSEGAAFEDPIASYPVPTPVSESGSRGFAGSRSLTLRSGDVEWTGSSSPRQTADSPTSGWAAGTATTTGVIDWTPYYSTEPATIRSLQAAIGTQDVGVQIVRYNAASVRTYQASKAATALTVEDDLTAVLVTIDTVASGGYDFAYFDYDPANDGFWISYKRTNGTREALEFYDWAAGTQTDVEVGAGLGGRIRCSRALNAMIVHTGGTFRVFDLTTKALSRVVTLPAEAANLAMWSLRAFDGFVCVTGQDENGAGSFSYIWKQDWTYVGRYRLVLVRQGLGSSLTGGLIPHCVPLTLADGHEVLVVNAMGTMLVLSTRYDGVIPYADCEGKSCAAVLAEIAAVLLQTFDVSPYEVATFRPRMATGSAVVTLGAPLDGEEMPLWEDYRTSFEVTGKDAADADVEYVAGDTGDSARRGDRSVDIAITAGMAQTIAEAAHAFFSVRRREVQGTWPEGARRVRPFDVVTYAGREWIALESELDLQDEEQDLRLVSVA